MLLANADLIPSLIQPISSKVVTCITIRIPHIRLRVTNYVKQIDLLNHLPFLISSYVNEWSFLKCYANISVLTFVCVCVCRSSAIETYDNSIKLTSFDALGSLPIS